eukprot:TRINITY_DN11295_c0_g1_i2.p1 TRINITY_DN11295_c0_g1~~TRINITY_DN11295_c0_g1_i2.p1  ORF type:complete len:343 (+),score=84.37 TRINITY_DN11295_c0_g1_i2:147-1175(+)
MPIGDGEVEKQIEEMISCIDNLYKYLEGKKRELTSGIQQAFNKATVFTSSLKITLQAAKDDVKSLTAVQKENARSVLDSIKTLNSDLENYVNDKMRNSFEPIFAGVYKHLIEEFGRETYLVARFNKRQKTPCSHELTKQLFKASLMNGYKLKNSELKLNKCADCTNPIVGKNLQDFLKSVPVYRLREILPEDLLLPRMQEQDKCRECNETINEKYQPVALSCDCMVCSKCVAKFNAESINSKIDAKNGKDKYVFKCPSCKERIEKQQFFMLFGDVKYPLNVLKTLTLLERDSSIAKYFKCCTSCLDKMGCKEPKESNCTHLFKCKDWYFTRYFGSTCAGKCN